MAKRLMTIYALIGLAVLAAPPAGADDGKATARAVAESASADTQSLTPDTFYPGLTFNPTPLGKIDLKKPAVLDPSPIKKESPEELIIKRALGRDKKKPQKTEAKTNQSAKGKSKQPSLVDVDLGPGAEFTMGYRYLDYGKLDDAAIPFNTEGGVPSADYYGKNVGGQEQVSHELSIGVKVDLE